MLTSVRPSACTPTAELPFPGLLGRPGRGGAGACSSEGSASGMQGNSSILWVSLTRLPRTGLGRGLLCGALGWVQRLHWHFHETGRCQGSAQASVSMGIVTASRQGTHSSLGFSAVNKGSHLLNTLEVHYLTVFSWSPGQQVLFVPI